MYVVPAGSVHKMAHCLWKGLDLGVVLTITLIIMFLYFILCYRYSNSGTGIETRYFRHVQLYTYVT